MLAALPDEDEELDVDVEVDGVDGIEGIDGIDDEEGDGMLGAEGAPLVAQPASIIEQRAAEHSTAHGNVTGNFDRGCMIRFHPSPSRRGNCATAWRCGCRPCPARVQ